MWRWLMGAVVWLLAVAVVAAVAWFGIDSAGRQVAGADAVQPAPAPTRTLANVTPTVSPSPIALGAERPGSGIDSGTRFGTPSGTPSVPGSDDGQTGTYSSAGGDVAVRCVGGTAAVWTTRVADGWRIGQAGLTGAGLRVLFVAGDGRTEGVGVTCPNGRPSFSPVQ